MKLIISYALAGIGHQKAAYALAHAAATASGGAPPQVVDALTYTPGFFRWSYPRAYLFLVTRLPLVWGAAYYASDARWLQGIVAPARAVFNACQARRLRLWLEAEEPDVVMATHFLPAQVTAALKQQLRLRATLITIVTDYYPHAFWVNPGTDGYAVGAETTRQTLLRRGVDPARIRVVGIPVDPKFSQELNRAALRGRWQLDDRRLTVLVTSGGFGVGPVEELVRTIIGRAALRERVQLLVVCGRNPALQARLERLADRQPDRLRVFGFVSNMQELMASSDVVITKPGGLTVTEALVRHLPMILIAPIWGQEQWNARWLAAQGTAVMARRLGEIVAHLEAWVRDPSALERVREACATAAHPHAAEQIVAWARELSRG